MGNTFGQTICQHHNVTDSEFQDIQDGPDPFQLVTEGYLILVIGLVGLLGNIASIWTFSRQRIHRTFHNLLLVLTIFDTVSLCTFSVIAEKTANLKMFLWGLKLGLPKSFGVSFQELQTGGWPKMWRCTKFQVPPGTFDHGRRARKTCTLPIKRPQSVVFGALRMWSNVLGWI